MLDEFARFWVWVVANREWIFSGIGVVVIAAAGRFLQSVRNRQFARQRQPTAFADRAHLPLRTHDENSGHSAGRSSTKKLTATAVTVTGAVQTGTPPTRAWFEFDKDIAKLSSGLGVVLPQVYGSPFTDRGTFPVEQRITGLTPDTTYYYRLVVSNRHDEYKALNVQQFTTKPRKREKTAPST